MFVATSCRKLYEKNECMCEMSALLEQQEMNSARLRYFEVGGGNLDVSPSFSTAAQPEGSKCVPTSPGGSSQPPRVYEAQE